MEIKSIVVNPTNEKFNYATATLVVEGKTFEFGYAMLNDQLDVNQFTAYQVFETEKIQTQAAAYLYERIGSEIAVVVSKMANMMTFANKHDTTIV